MATMPTSAPVTIRTAERPRLAPYLNPMSMLITLSTHRGLIGQFARREVAERHKGAYLGSLWNIISPIITLLIYGFVFGYVFDSRWRDPALAASEDQGGAAASFLLPFFLGHSMYHFFSECVGRAPFTVAARPNLVKKVVFPVEILPVVSVLSAMVYPLIAIPLLFIAQLVVVGSIPLTVMMLPLMFLPLIFAVMGISWFLASLGVYSRDIKNVVQVVLQLLIFMTPVFYSPERIPPRFRGLYGLNPLGFILEQARGVTLWGREPQWVKLAMVTLASLVVMQLGYAFFMRTKRGLADVI